MDESAEDATDTKVLPEGSSGSPDDMDSYAIVHPYEKVETSNEAVEYDDIPDQHNEEAVQYEIFTEKSVVLLNIWMQKQVIILM